MDSKQNVTEKKSEFQKPRHWVSLDELTPEYWNDEQAQTLRGQEFSHKPIETLEKIEQMDKTGVSRRDFLTVMGASMAMASFACARRPVNKIIPYVVQPQELTPGVPLYYASTWKGHGVLVKTREGRPIKLEGNNEHPVNQGALSAQGHASILNLYDPDRLKAPMKGAKAGSKSATSWSEVDAAVAAALKESKKVRVISYPQTGESTRRAMREFMSAFSDSKWIEVDPLGMDEVSEGQLEAYGTRVVPHFAFDQADVVVSFSADFLGAWGDSVGNTVLWKKKRKLGDHKDSKIDFSKCYVFESNFSITGANSDGRFAIVPGTEVAAALAVAHELIVVQKKGKFAGNADVAAVLNGNVEEWLLKAGGISREKIKEVATDLGNAKGKSLVIGQGSPALQAVVNLINSNLENDGKTVDGVSNLTLENSSIRSLVALQAEMDAGQVDTLIVHHLNPVYFLPNGSAFGEAMKKVKNVIAINDRVDETANFADVVAAESHFLECWGDAHPQTSIYSLQQPAISPIHDTRSLEECLINWTRAGVKSSGLLAQVAGNPKGNFYDFVKENWKQTLFVSHGKGQSFLDFWELALQKGVLESKAGPSHERAFKTGALRLAKEAVANLKNLSLGQSKKGAAVEGTGVAIQLYSTMAMGDGQYANNAWLMEMPDPISSVSWDNYLNIGPSYAKELGLNTNDVVTVKAEDVSFEIPVHVQPGMVKGAASIALGYGRSAAGKVGNQVGANAFRLAKVSSESGFQLSGLTVSLTKTGKKYELAATQSHFRTEERPILNDVTLDAFKKNNEAEMETEPKVRMKTVPTLWTAPIDYSKSPYRWMMSIDLSACTGCGACVVACQAENNIPVVGRDRVRMGRDMHWIRIDRYYSGDENSPQAVFQPMLCQHCENAPCETVCPVVATSHSDDGLNQMTYSRCVGTRYCQNNCPYKVRRFNFFDHWKDYKDTMNMVWNPDVTVRSRGIMEKCTFCVQRINEAKGIAKDHSRKILDGELKTACQQSCPAEAIVFGNVNDPNSEISQLIKNPRGFRSMEVLNTKPSITYLTKVRNVEESEHEGHSQEAEHHGHS